MGVHWPALQTGKPRSYLIVVYFGLRGKRLRISDCPSLLPLTNRHVSFHTRCNATEFEDKHALSQTETRSPLKAELMTSSATKNIGPLIADSAKISLSYAQRMLAGIEPTRFARFATVGGVAVTSNHPAFVYGHLSLYACRVVEQLGGDATAIKPSDEFVAAFSHTATCVDDPDGTVYPPMGEITERVLTGYQLAIDTLLNADDALFLVPNVNEAMRSKFATNGSMQAFYVGGHVMIHMGQVSAWRRMMGLGPA